MRWIVLILLYVGSQLVSTLVATATADPTQRRIMLVLPLVFVIILYRYPSGLLLYWITTNLWTIGQQLRDPAPKAAAPETGSGDGSNGATPKETVARKETLADAMGERQVAEPKPAPTRAPSPPARKKKKRSGRRR